MNRCTRPVIAAGIVLLAALALLVCGRRPPTAPALPDAAFAPLTEEEFARFGAALPAVVSALVAAGFKPEGRPDEPIPAGLARIVGGMERQPGVAESLAAYQTDWAAFSTTLHKVLSAAAAIAVDIAAAADSARGNAQADKRLSDDRTFAGHVPQENREFVIGHQRQLSPLSRLGETSK